MPYPQNVECAQRVEAACSAAGATPATIAILGGVIHVGLDSAQLEQLGRAGKDCKKCSRRDFAHVIATKSHGATTVSGTMFVASLVGISVFVTGGIGGVHRGVESTMDISADLNELGRTPVAVICAGVKSILDIPRTLEYLETQGVPVACVGADEFPAFFTRRSGCPAPMRVDSGREAAAMIHAGKQLDMANGYVFGVPIPESEEAAAEPIEAATSRALAEANEQGVKGRDITPFLLGRINQLTSGASLKSNIALIMHNVQVGAGIAVELAKLQKSGSAAVTSSFPDDIRVPVVIGGTNQDLLGRPVSGGKLLLGTSNPGTIARCWGGVGRNVAEALGRLGTQPILITAVGADEQGAAMQRHCAEVGISTAGVVSSPSHATSTYMAILDEKGDLFTTIADMAATEVLDAGLHLPSVDAMRTCPVMVVDGNVSPRFLAAACDLAYESNTPVFFEPTSIEKCVRIVPSLLRNRVTFVSPSAAELLAMAESIDAQKVASGVADNRRDAYEHNHSTTAVEAQCRAILHAIATAHARSASPQPLRPVHIVLKRGSLGALVASLLPTNDRTSPSRVSIVHLPSRPLQSVVNTSGAGDTLVGATCWALLERAATKGEDINSIVESVHLGMRAAEMTLQAEQSVSPMLAPQELIARQKQFARAQ